MGSFPVQRIAHFVQFPQSIQRIAALQQWPPGIVGNAAEQGLWRGTQIDNGCSPIEPDPIQLAQYRTAAGCNHARRRKRQFIDDLLLDIAKRRLTFAFEILSDRTAQAILDDTVSIDKGLL